MEFNILIFSCLLLQTVYGQASSAPGPSVLMKTGDSSVTLHCVGAKNWTNPFGSSIKVDESSHKYKFNGDNLTITRIGEHDVGKYFCQGKDGVSTLEVFSPPFIKPLDKSVNVVQGMPVMVECIGWGHPEPTFHWSRMFENGTSLTLSNSTVLYINTTTLEDYGIYRCQGNNVHGSANQTTKIRVKDKLGPLWPFIGIVLEVVVLIVIIVVYEKRKHKTDPEDAAKLK